MKKFFKMTLLVLAVIALGATVSSCSNDDDDTTPPVISNLDPADGEEILIGAPMHLEFDMTDNAALGSYVVEIHNNFDHHTHESVTKAGEGEDVAFFYRKEFTDATGKKNHHVHTHEIVIPANTIEGDYHLMIYCTDAAGNEVHVARNIVLSKTAAPDED